MPKKSVTLEIAADASRAERELQKTQRQLNYFKRQAAAAGRGTGGIFAPLKKNVGGLNGAMNQTVGRFRNIASAGAGLTGPMVGAAVGVAAVGEAVQFVGEGIDKLKRLTAETKLLENATGMSTESSSAWVGVARRFGLSSQQLTTGLGIMSKRMVLATGTGTAATKQLKLFAQAGISPALLKSKDMDRTLIALADKFKGMPNGVGKTDLAMKLFGRSGRQLIPMLNQGGDKVKALKREMALLGLTINDKTKKDVTNLGKAQKKLSDLWDGVQIQLATTVIPKLSQFAGAATDAAAGLRSGVKPAGQLAGKLYDVGSSLESIWNVLKRLDKFNSLLQKLDPVTRTGKILYSAGKKAGLFATGGIVNGAQNAIVGEDGPEAIIPLSRKHRARGAALYAQAGAAMGMGTGGNTFVVNNYGNSLDENQLAARFAWQMQTRTA